MLNVANAFSSEFCIPCNPKKTKPLGSVRLEQTSLFFEGTAIQCGQSAIYVGHVFGPMAKDNDIDAAVNEPHRRTNVIIRKFNKGSPPARYQLFKYHCMCLYGSQLWEMSSKNIVREKKMLTHSKMVFLIPSIFYWRILRMLPEFY